MGASVLSLLCSQFGVLSLCFPGEIASFIQADHLVLPDTDLKLSKI